MRKGQAKNMKASNSYGTLKVRARLSKWMHEASTRLNTNESSRPVSSDRGIPRAAKTDCPTAEIKVSAARAIANGKSDVFGLSDLSRTKAIYPHMIHLIGAYFAAARAEWESRKR
jgi:hypothetical protein